MHLKMTMHWLCYCKNLICQYKNHGKQIHWQLRMQRNIYIWKSFIAVIKMACVYLSFSNGLEISQMSSNMTRSQKYFVFFEFSKIMQDLKQLGFGCLYLFFYSDMTIIFQNWNLETCPIIANKICHSFYFQQMPTNEW